jgi:hypothetical protein
VARRRRYACATSGWASSSATLGTCAAGRPRLAAGKRPRRRSGRPRARLCRPDDKLAPGAAIDLRAGRSRLSRHSDARSGVPPQVNRVTARHWVPRAVAAFRCDRSPGARPPRRRPVRPLAPKERFRGAKPAPDRGLPFDATLCRPARLDYAPGEALPLRQPGPVAAWRTATQLQVSPTDSCRKACR